MTVAKLLLGLLCAIGISAGQIFFKLAAITMPPIKGINSIWYVLFNPYLIIALVIYSLTTGLWIWLLRLIPLKHAYPLFALAFLIVPILEATFLKEKFELKTVLGGFFIMLGVYISVK